MVGERFQGADGLIDIGDDFMLHRIINLTVLQMNMYVDKFEPMYRDAEEVSKKGMMVAKWMERDYLKRMCWMSWTRQDAVERGEEEMGEIDARGRRIPGGDRRSRSQRLVGGRGIGSAEVETAVAVG